MESSQEAAHTIREHVLLMADMNVCARLDAKMEHFKVDVLPIEKDPHIIH